MAQSKTWVATDIKQGKLSLINIDGILYLERRYEFVDADDNVIEDIAGDSYTDEISISALPQDILAALQTINTYTYNKILEQEDMQDS